MHENIQSLKERTEAALEQLANRAEGADQTADSILQELRVILRETPGAGEILGPLLGRLQTARKARPDAAPVHWLPVGGGYLAIGHRPKAKAIPLLGQQGATHVLTLLSETEGAKDIGASVQKAGIVWLWLPLESAVPPAEERDAEVSLVYESLRQALASAGKIYIHCSAGIHRTGMVTNGLLLSLGLSALEAKDLLGALRVETGEGVGEDRLSWGNRFRKSS